MSIKTRKENPFLKPRKTPRPKKKEEKQPIEIRPVPAIVPRNWHPVKRKGRSRSLVTKLAKALKEKIHLESYEMCGFELATRMDTHKGGHEVSKFELDQMRKIAFPI